MRSDPLTLDHKIICGIVDKEAKVLDLGCGDGTLMFRLAKEKGAKTQGIELDERSIYSCVAKGLSVFHSDIDSGLPEYPDKSFDYVILNQTLQQAKKAEYVLQESLRVGKKVIVGFPNFAHIAARYSLCFKGEAPITKSLPYRWYDSPNIHFLSIKDFRNYCKEKNVSVISAHYLGGEKEVKFWPNLFATDAIFVIEKN